MRWFGLEEWNLSRVVGFVGGSPPIVPGWLGWGYTPLRQEVDHLYLLAPPLGQEAPSGLWPHPPAAAVDPTTQSRPPRLKRGK